MQTPNVTQMSYTTDSHATTLKMCAEVEELLAIKPDVQSANTDNYGKPLHLQPLKLYFIILSQYSRVFSFHFSPLIVRSLLISTLQGINGLSMPTDVVPVFLQF